MYTIIPLVGFAILALISGFTAYKRCKIQKIKFPKTISIITIFVTFFIIALLAKTQVVTYAQDIFPPNTNAFSVYSILFLTGLYLIFIAITEDLLRNLSIFISGFIPTKK